MSVSLHKPAKGPVLQWQQVPPRLPYWKHVGSRAWEAFIALTMCVGGALVAYEWIYVPLAKHLH